MVILIGYPTLSLCKLGNIMVGRAPQKLSDVMRGELIEMAISILGPCCLGCDEMCFVLETCHI